MIRVGLTGGMGAGKSTAIGILRRRGLPAIDVDEIAHRLLVPGTEAYREVVSRFGTVILDERDGTVCRQVLGERVFGDAGARRDLEAILHPRIQAAWNRDLDDRETAGTAVAVVAIPLLFEKGYENRFDLVVTVACLEATRRARLAARGWSDEMIRRREAAQCGAGEKVVRADCVIWTEGPLRIHEGQWLILLGRWLRAAGVP